MLDFFFLLIRRPPRSTRTDTLFPSPTLFRSVPVAIRFVAETLPRNANDKILKRDLKGVFAEEDLAVGVRAEEHTSELQSLMRISYAVFCLKKTNQGHEDDTMNIIVPKGHVGA